MRSIVEQYNACRHLGTSEQDLPPIPVLGRLCRSPVKRLGRAYRDRASLAMLVGQSRFASGYVLDRFIAAIATHSTVVRVEEIFDHPTAFMDSIMRSIGFESRATSLAHLDHAFGLFLRYQKTRRRRTVLAIRDIDAHGEDVLARILQLIERAVVTDSGLMVIATGPAYDSLEPMDPVLEVIARRAAVRIILTPFVLSETREFIRDRFERNVPNGGGQSDPNPGFDVFATQLIHELSSGTPETVDLLCRTSIGIAASDNRTAIETSDVKAAARLVGLLQPLSDERSEPSGRTQQGPANPPGQLIVKIQGAPEMTVRLDEGNVLIGRDRMCDVCVADEQVSRLHGLIVRAADGVHYLDLGSTNGSAVNGETVRHLLLENNDVIAIGDARIIYSAKDVAESAEVDPDATDTFKILRLEYGSSITPAGGDSRKRRKP